jgi:hypothetical protein
MNVIQYMDKNMDYSRFARKIKAMQQEGVLFYSP